MNIPDTDTLGSPTAPTTSTRQVFAVVVDCDIQGAPGPHLLSGEDTEAEARERLAWWQDNRPDVNPTLVRREIVTTRGPWESA